MQSPADQGLIPEYALTMVSPGAMYDVLQPYWGESLIGNGRASALTMGRSVLSLFVRSGRYSARMRVHPDMAVILITISR